MAWNQKTYDLFLLSPKEFESLVKDFKYLDSVSAKNLYTDILKTVKEVISDDKLDCLMNLSLVLNEIMKTMISECLRNYKPTDKIGHFNLVSLACKNKATKILEYIFSDQSQTLYNLSVEMTEVREKESLMCVEDEFCHNAFYYAIRSNTTDLLCILVDKWQSQERKEELYDILSKSFKELQLRNVFLTREMQLFVLSKIFDLHLLGISTDRNRETGNSWEQIKRRIDLVVKHIRSIKSDYWDQDPDEKFIFIAEFIVKNIHVLKTLLKSTYDRLPWEEIEFCLVIFIKCCKSYSKPNLVYNCLLNKKQFLKHLHNFSVVLDKQHNEFKSNRVRQLAKSVEKKTNEKSDEQRNRIIEQIVDNHSEFRELYDDYEKVRDYCSLEIIKQYSDLIKTSDAIEQRKHLLVCRVLQVMGEHLKNSLESPKLSNKTANLLLSSLSPNTREIITSLRDNLSHENFLLIRTQIQNKGYLFKNIQTDILKIKALIPDVLYTMKIAAVKALMKKVELCDHNKDVKECFGPYQHSLDLYSADKEETIKLKGDFERLEEMLLCVEKNINDKTEAEKMLFEQIHYLIQKEKERSESLKQAVTSNAYAIRHLNIYISSENVFCHAIRKIAHRFIDFSLEDPSRKCELFEEPLTELLKSVLPKRLQRKNKELRDIAFKLHTFLTFEMGTVKWMENFRNIINRKPNKKTDHLNKNQTLHEDLLTSKLSDLKEALVDFDLKDGFSCAEFSSFETNKELQAVTEMLVLDILSTLEESCYRNPFFLDNDYPLLTGRNLRNHLAHGNFLIDVCLEESSAQLFIYAKKIAALPKNAMFEVLSDGKEIDRFIKCDCGKLKNAFDFGLRIIDNQQNLFVSLEEGNTKEVGDCLREGADVYGRDGNFSTCLHFAVKANDWGVVKWALKQGLNINSKNNAGEDLVHVAARFNSTEIIRHLVEEEQMSLISRNENFKTALHVAVESQSNEVVKYISKFDICRTLIDRTVMTPLHTAICWHNNDAAHILLEKERNVDEIKTWAYQTTLHVATEYDNFDLVKLLILRKADVDAKCDFGDTPLHTATISGNLEIVNTLVTNGADVNAQNEAGDTPLQNSAEIGNLAIVHFLLRHGAHVNASCDPRSTPLIQASGYGHTSIVELLLQEGAFVNSKTHSGLSALHFAAFSGHYRIVELLLNHGAIIDCRSDNMKTALHGSASGGHKEIVKLLLSKGSDINATDSNEHTPLWFATVGRHLEIVYLLINEGADINCRDSIGSTSLHFAASNADRGMVEFLLKKGADIRASCLYEITPLFILIAKGLLDLLTANGKNVHLSDVNGNTLLHLAAKAGNHSLVKYCIENGCDINARNNYALTALHLATQRNNQRIIVLLLSKGAGIDAKDDNGHTPLLIAARNNYVEVVKILISHKTLNLLSMDMDKIESLLKSALFGYHDIVDIFLQNFKFQISNELKQSMLFNVVRANHKHVLTILLERGFEINGDAKPLHIAVLNNHYDMVETLLAKGANPNLLDKNNCTPLDIAVQLGNVDTLQILLSGKTGICIENKFILAAVEAAIRRDQSDIIKFLCQINVIDVNTKNLNGCSIIHTSSLYGSLDVTKCLVLEGGDINAIDEKNRKPVHIATEKGFKGIVEFYLTCDDLQVEIEELFFLAASNSNVNICEFLLERYPNMKICQEDNNSLINVVLEKGHKDVLFVLLNHGFYCNVQNSDLKTLTTYNDAVSLLKKSKALFTAVRKNSVSEVETLLREESNSKYCLANAKLVKIETVLHYASWKGYEKTVDTLLKYNSNPNTQTKKGCTPLHYAVKFSHFSIVKALLSKGAIYNGFSKTGKTPLDYAKEGKTFLDRKIRDYLLFLRFIFTKVQNDDRSVLDNLISKDEEQKRAVVRAKNQEGKTLIDVAHNSNFSCIDKLQMLFETELVAELKSAEKKFHEKNYDEALLAFENILEKRFEIFGAESCPVLDAKLQIAKIFYDQGNLDRALHLCRAIYESSKKILGENHLQIISNEIMIAFLLSQQGNKQEALKLFEAVRIKLKQELEPDDFNIISFENILSTVLFEMRTFNEVLKINNEIEQKCRKKKDDNHRLILADTYFITATILQEQQKLDEAFKLFKKAYETRRDVLTAHHPLTLRALSKVAEVSSLQGKLHESLKMFEKILNIQKLFLPDNHINILTNKQLIGDTLCLQGRHLKALKIFLSLEPKIAAVAPDSDLFKGNKNKIAEIKYNLSVHDFQFVFDRIKNEIMEQTS